MMTGDKMEREKGRLLYIDILRILACFSVVMLHSAAQYWYDIPVTDRDWLIMNSYNAIVRFGVPIFVMISGVLFLDQKSAIDRKRLFFNNVLRLAIIYVVWSVIYGIYDCTAFEWSALKPENIFAEIYSGRYHLWYIPMIIGLYLLIPIWKKWLEGAVKQDVQYFLLLFMIFKIIRSTVMVIKPMECLAFVGGIFEFGTILDYQGYLILGYYIAHYGVEAKWYKYVYISGILGLVINIILGNYKSLRAGIPNGEIYDSFSLFTCFIVIALFVFGVEKMGKWNVPLRLQVIIKEVSLATLGIYLMHLLWMEVLQTIGIDSMMMSPLIGVPLCAVICFGLSFICAAILRRIPLIGRYVC